MRGYYNNPVLRAQENLARTIQGGLSGLGDRPLEESKFKLFEKQTLADIARKDVAGKRDAERLGLQKNADVRAGNVDVRAEASAGREGEAHDQRMKAGAQALKTAAQTAARNARIFQLQLPGMNLSKNQAVKQAKQDEIQGNLGKTPLTPAAFVNFASGESRENVSDALTGEYLQQVLEATGGKVVQTPQGQRIIKKNGEEAIFDDLQTIWPIAEPIISSSRDRILFAKQKLRQMEKLDKLPEGYHKLKKNVDDPEWQLLQYEKAQEADANRLRQSAAAGHSTKAFEFNMAKRAQKIAAIQSTMAKKVEHARKLEIEEAKQTGKESSRFKGAQDLYKHLTKKTSESAGAILAKMLAGEKTGGGEIQQVKDELADSDQKLLDRMVEILNERYGVKSEPTQTVQQSAVTHDFIPGQGLVPRQ